MRREEIMKGIKYHKRKASFLRLVRAIKKMIPDAVDTVLYCYFGLAPITVPATLLILAGAVQKILQMLF